MKWWAPNAPAGNANARCAEKCVNAPTMTIRTVISIPAHRILVRLPIESIRRHSRPTVMMVNPTASQWESAGLVCQKYPRYWAIPIMPVDMISGVTRSVDHTTPTPARRRWR